MQCELRSLNMVQRVIRWYIGQFELRSLKYGAKRHQVIHWARWAKKLKYGAKSPQVVHWAMWAKEFKRILNFLAHLAQCTNWGRFAPYLNFLAHLAQCATGGRFAPYIKLLSSKYGATHPQVVHWAMWAKKFKIWCKWSSGGTLGNVS
jgi:hypothetical protein